MGNLCVTLFDSDTILDYLCVLPGIRKELTIRPVR